MSNHSFLFCRFVSSPARSWRTCWKVPRARREHTRLPHTLYSQPIVPSQRFRIPEQIWSSSSSSSSSSRARISTWRENRELARASESHFSSLVAPLSSRYIHPHLPHPPLPSRPFNCLSLSLSSATRAPLYSRIFLLLTLRGSTFARAIVLWRLYGESSAESQTWHVREVTDSNEAKAPRGARWLLGSFNGQSHGNLLYNIIS